MVNLSTNPKYKRVDQEFPLSGAVLYAPAAETDYHMSRYVAANAQNIYSQSGATKELLGKIVDHVLDLCNSNEEQKRLKTDIALLMNNIKVRLSYPVDEDCALRMGCIFYFLEDEDPDRVDDLTIQRKVLLAKKDPDLYSFFLSRGLVNTPAYSELLTVLEDKDYFVKRREALAAMESLTP